MEHQQMKTLELTLDDSLNNSSTNNAPKSTAGTPLVSSFRFKQFAVQHFQSTMKVGTDAVLLGAWAEVENAERILDIGTGCGIIALMLAQRSTAKIDAIEVDNASCEEAGMNFANSSWCDRLHLINKSIQEYATSGNPVYDTIVSNPPFFINSLKSAVASRNLARHNDTMNSTELIAAIKKLLKPEGKFSLILPVNESMLFTEEAAENGLYCHVSLLVRPKQNLLPNRVLMQFGFQDVRSITDELSIRKPTAEFTDDYRKLTRDFYLSF